MLQWYGPELARSTAVEVEVTCSTTKVEVALRRGASGARYYFVRTSDREHTLSGSATVKERKSGFALAFDFLLEPFGSEIFYLPPGARTARQGEWLPKLPAPPLRPRRVTAPVTLTTARCKADPGPRKWRKLESPSPLAALGIYDCHYLFYRLRLKTDRPSDAICQVLEGDELLGSLHDNRLYPAAAKGGRFTFKLPAGKARLVLLYENFGHANGGEKMEAPAGLQRLQVLPSGLERPLEHWAMHTMGPFEPASTLPHLPVNDWHELASAELEANQLQAAGLACFRTHFELPQASSVKWQLLLQRVDDLGWLYVNGELAGKTTDWSRSYAFDVTRWLKPGENTVVIVVKNLDGPGGLGQVLLSPIPERPGFKLEIGRPKGFSERWFDPQFEPAGWRTVRLPETADCAPSALLKWYRLEFRLPRRKRGLWVPWYVRLAAKGNGFVYLNGHCLGRYWQVGPQRDFYMPECWLNFGEDSRNVLAIELRPLSEGARLEQVKVAPYREYAEFTRE